MPILRHNFKKPSKGNVNPKRRISRAKITCTNHTPVVFLTTNHVAEWRCRPRVWSSRCSFRPWIVQVRTWWFWIGLVYSSFCCLLTTMGENETSSSVQEMNIQEVKDVIAKEFQLEIAEKFEGKLVSNWVFRAILRCAWWSVFSFR